MIKKILNLGALGLLAVASFSSCSDEQQFTDFNTNAKKLMCKCSMPNCRRCAIMCRSTQ